MTLDEYRSFADPETELILVTSDSPVNVDGFKLGEPTGEVMCPICRRVAAAPAYIPHTPDCPQRDVASEWYESLH